MNNLNIFLTSLIEGIVFILFIVSIVMLFALLSV